MSSSIQYFTEVCIKKFIELQEKLIENPNEFDRYVLSVEQTVKDLGVKIIEETLEKMDEAIRVSSRRKNNWVVESTNEKQLLTSMGNVRFKKTLYAHKTRRLPDGKEEMCYLLDKALGFTKNQRMTTDVTAKVYEEAVQTSYRRAGEVIGKVNTISKMAVKEQLHNTKFPPNFKVLENKRRVPYLYIDADEDHFSLQFQKKKGDLVVSTNNRKNNGAITKLVYVHEGIEPEAPGSKRNKLIRPHFFCRGIEQDNTELWKEIYDYIAATYDVDYIKKIYLNSDGGVWIKEGMKSIVGIKHVLDEFHLSKYISKMCTHMYDSADDARNAIYTVIRNGTKNEFIELAEQLKDYAKDDATRKRIDDSKKYITDNWSAAVIRIRRKESCIVGSSTEGHVYHILSKRMSTDPLGWSRHGGYQMGRLLEYYHNGGDMLELARYQKEILPVAAGAEELSNEMATIIQREKHKYRTAYQQELGKYNDIMQASISDQKIKQYYCCDIL